MKIDHLQTVPDRAGRYTVRFENGTVMRLYRQTVEDFALYTGKEFSQEQYIRLKDAAEKMSAKMRAVRIVAASSISETALKGRLIQKGESKQASEDAVSWLREMAVLDDEKTARSLVASCAGKGYGLARVKQVLYEKQIPKDLWDAVLQDYPEQTEYILQYLRTKCRDFHDPKMLKKSIDALIRRGHSYSSIRKAINMMDSDSMDLMEEE